VLATLTGLSRLLILVELSARRATLRTFGKNMNFVPEMIGGAKVICASAIDERHQFTGGCKQIVAGQLMGQMAGLAICQYEGEDNYYLFGCDEDWSSATDTWHQSLEEALDQVEYEYTGSKDTMTYKDTKPNKAVDSTATRHASCFLASLGAGAAPRAAVSHL